MTLDPSSWPGGGGGSTPPTARALYSGNSVTIPDATPLSLSWDSLDGGTALLDITSPLNPTVLTAGVYAVSVVATGSGLTVGGFYRATLKLDGNGDNAQVRANSPSSVAAAQSPDVEVSATYYIPAGGTVLVEVLNADGASDRDFRIRYAVIQQVS